MTEHQRHLFGKILDLNWEIQCGAHNEVVVSALSQCLEDVEREIAEDMGTEAWESFKEKGKRMFSPA